MATTVKFTWNQATLNKVSEQMQIGLINLGGAIAGREKQLAPVDSGALVNSIEAYEEKQNVVIVKAGGKGDGSSVPYAYRRNFENNLHPNTKHYAENSLESVVRGGVVQYFKIGGKA